MSDPYGSPTIPAAWYPDPADARQLRYWDGTGWTNQTTPTPTPSPPAVPPPAAVYSPAAPSPYTPLGFTDDSEPVGAADSGWSPNTLSGWLCAFSPMLLAAFALMPIPADLLNASDLPGRAGLVVLFIAVAISLAAIDRLQLRHREFLRTPPPVLAVVAPIFSIARAVYVGRRGLGLAAVSLLIQGAVAALLVVHFFPAAVGAVEAEKPTEVASSAGLVPPFSDAQKAALLSPEGMAAKIKFDAEGSALRFKTVTCDPIPSSELGVQVMCTAVGTIADYDVYVALIPTADGVPFTVTSVAPSLKL